MAGSLVAPGCQYVQRDAALDLLRLLLLLVRLLVAVWRWRRERLSKRPNVYLEPGTLKPEWITRRP